MIISVDGDARNDNNKDNNENDHYDDNNDNGDNDSSNDNSDNDNDDKKDNDAKNRVKEDAEGFGRWHFAEDSASPATDADLCFPLSHSASVPVWYRCQVLISACIHAARICPDPPSALWPRRRGRCGRRAGRRGFRKRTCSYCNAYMETHTLRYQSLDETAHAHTCMLTWKRTRSYTNPPTETHTLIHTFIRTCLRNSSQNNETLRQWKRNTSKN